MCMVRGANSTTFFEDKPHALIDKTTPICKYELNVQ